MLGMLFNSLEFLAFFTIVLLLYFWLPHRMRWILVLLCSYYFYMSAKAEYGVLLIVSTLMGYFGARWIEAEPDLARRKALLWASIVCNLSLLLFFKYANFISDNTRALLMALGIHFPPFVHQVILPIGISFYTFQAISYTVDVYNKRIPAERHIGIYSTYHAFFPQLVAGPIERGGHLLPQFYQTHRFSFEQLKSGLLLMLWGFFKKIVIADRLALLVNAIYENPYQHHGITLCLAAVCFAFQIYCDFSGYTDIARGSARIMGFELVINFNRPFISKNISEFWRRWHISLSSWFQDYVFTPLYLKITRWKIILSLSPKAKHAISFTLAIIIVEVLLGIWHGANWTFAAFGLFHGLLIPMYYFGRAWWDRLPNSIQIGFTFSLVCISLVFFRSRDIFEAWYIITHLVSGWSYPFALDIGHIGGLLGLSIAFFGIFLMLMVEALLDREQMRVRYQALPQWVRALMALILLQVIIFAGINKGTQFIYFQF